MQNKNAETKLLLKITEMISVKSSRPFQFHKQILIELSFPLGLHALGVKD